MKSIEEIEQEIDFKIKNKIPTKQELQRQEFQESRKQTMKFLEMQNFGEMFK
jgi:hypothetical protein